jgi:hypothetical protein
MYNCGEPVLNIVHPETDASRVYTTPQWTPIRVEAEIHRGREKSMYGQTEGQTRARGYKRKSCAGL